MVTPEAYFVELILLLVVLELIVAVVLVAAPGDFPFWIAVIVACSAAVATAKHEDAAARASFTSKKLDLVVGFVFQQSHEQEPVLATSANIIFRFAGKGPSAPVRASSFPSVVLPFCASTAIALLSNEISADAGAARSAA